MPRRRADFAPSTALGVALVRRRAQQRAVDVAEGVGIAHTTLLGLERGTHRPSYDTAVKLARWLGWSVEQVMEAAAARAPQQPGEPR